MKKTMMMLGAVLFAAWAMGAPLPSVTQPATVPGQVNFQGLLRNPNTGALYTNGIYTLEFKLYTTITGGNPVWGESYQVYVRDGYFNVMLGESGKEVSGTKPTYRGENLWKALWFDSSRNNRELWLSVTPWEDSAHNGIAAENRKEISPRQKLLTTPFAFRAQSAEYAEKAAGAFSVGGKLTVNGALEVKGGQSGINLQHVATSATELTLGTPDGTPNTVTVQGNTVKVKANSGLNVAPGGALDIQMAAGKSASITGGALAVSPDGDATVSMKSDKTFSVDGGSFKTRGSGTVSVFANGNADFGTSTGNGVVTVKGTGPQLIVMNNGATLVTREGNTYVQVQESEKNANIRAVNNVNMSGQNVTVSSSVTSIKANTIDLASNNYIFGKGKLEWWTGEGNNYTMPFQKRTMTVKTSSSKAQVQLDGGTHTSLYSWMVVGVDIGTKSYDVHAAVIMQNGVPYVKVYGHDSDTVTVHLLGIHKSFISDLVN